MVGMNVHLETSPFFTGPPIPSFQFFVGGFILLFLYQWGASFVFIMSSEELNEMKSAQGK